ncbi:MAG: hypothetical protein QGG40_16000, partial [Myxococcota bacterium]|nr:hypothetical protein [Myxococcota bacterium]
RRHALLFYWQSRAHTPEGTAVRRIVADYLEYEVQPSDWPVSPGEQEQANRACGCSEPLGLPFLGSDSGH